MSKSCPKGQYYCYTDKKCKKIPKGYMIGARGYLRQEPQDDDSKKNGNGNGNGHSKSNGSGGNGSGNGNGGNGGNGGGGGVSEATMTSSQKRKDTMLKKKYDDSDMKKNMKKQYGKEEGEKVYYATIRKQAMESKLGKLDEVGYYSGQDRDPNTGLPKGLKSIPGGKKDKPLKTVPHEILRAHTEIPVTDIKVSSMDEITDYKSFAAKAQEARDEKAKRREDKAKADKDYMDSKKERVKKGIKFYDKKGSGYIKGGVKTYNESAYTDFAKKFGLDPVADYAKIKRMMRQQSLKGVNTWSKGVYNKGDKMYEGSLHKWFKGSKSKDGKGGWVNVVTGGTCASDEPGEGTPKCVSSAKRASMSKAERLSAARRKKKADPGQQSKSGAAKPTYVSTDSPRKKKKMKEELSRASINQMDAETRKLYLRKRSEMIKDKLLAQDEKKMKKEELKHISVPLKTIKKRSDFLKQYQGDPGLKYNTDGKDLKAHYEPDGESIEETKDKKGKGSGTKDACYHKVKSRYSVWPSAYASGALVKCRKVGAANWGNSKKEEFEGNIDYKTFMEKCWKGYEKKGMKTMFGKRYPNCVKKEETQLEDSRLTSSNDMQSKMYADKNKSGKNMSDDEIKKEKGGREFLARLKAAKEKMKKEAYSANSAQQAAIAIAKRKKEEDDMVAMKKKGKKIEEKVNLKDKSSQYARSTKEVDTAMTDHVNRTRGKNYNLKTGRVTDVGRYRRPSKREARNELISMNKESKTYSQFAQECWKTHKQVGYKKKGGKMVPNCVPKNEEVEIIDEKKSPAWQRKAGKNPSGGLNAKGVASYRAANPGSKLKTAVTTKPSKLKKGSKAANRRKSFCARMTGMKKRLTSAKTARDPDSRINKALRKWNC